MRNLKRRWISNNLKEPYRIYKIANQYVCFGDSKGFQFCVCSNKKGISIQLKKSLNMEKTKRMAEVCEGECLGFSWRMNIYILQDAITIWSPYGPTEWRFFSGWFYNFMGHRGDSFTNLISLFLIHNPKVMGRMLA